MVGRGRCMLGFGRGIGLLHGGSCGDERGEGELTLPVALSPLSCPPSMRQRTDSPESVWAAINGPLDATDVSWEPLSNAKSTCRPIEYCGSSYYFASGLNRSSRGFFASFSQRDDGCYALIVVVKLCNPRTVFKPADIVPVHGNIVKAGAVHVPKLNLWLWTVR